MNELWKRMVDFIKRMTESMSPPQIVGLVLLVLLLVGSLIWLVSWSGSDGLVLLVGAEEQMDIRAQIKQKLDERNVQYQVRDNGIYVHKNERDAIGMDLAGDGLFTDKDIFSWLFGNDFTSTSDVREKRNVISLQTRLERMFASTDAIKSARVQITPGSEDRVIVSRGEDSKASVAVSLKAGKKLSEQNVLAMANILAGAVKGLKPENVQITDTSLRLYKVPSPGSEVWLGNTKNEAQSKIEKEREGKIRDLLARTVGGEAYISFYVELDLRRIDDLKIERVNTLDVSDERSSKKDEGAGGAGGDPNLPERGVGTLSSTGKKSEEIKSKVNSIPSKETTTKTYSPPGSIKDASVAILIPKKQGVTVGLTEADIKDLVAKGVGIDLTKISVKFAEVPTPTATEGLTEPTVTAWERFQEMADKYGGQAILGLFAFISLIMIYKMVKRALSKDMLAELEKVRGKIASEEMITPELVTAEVGESKVTQMRASVKELVQRNPRSVATLLKRWVIGR